MPNQRLRDIKGVRSRGVRTPFAVSRSLHQRSVHVVGCELCVFAEQWHHLNLRLGHQQAVEGVAVVVGQCVDMQGMAQGDRQHP